MLLVAASACGTPAPQPVSEVARDPDVREILPEGASLVVIARPRELFEAPASATVIRGLVPDEQLEAIRVQHGIDPRTLEHLAFGTYESGEATGRVLVTQGPFRAEVAVAEIAHRMVPRESSTEGALPRAGGLLHGTRMDALAVGPHTLVLVIGPPALTARVTRAAAGEAPPAIAGPVRAALEARPEPFLGIRPVPLDLPPGGSVALLLAEEESMLIAAAPESTDALRVAVVLDGAFPPGADQNFQRLVASLARSTMGEALGLREALPTLVVEASESQVRLEARLGAAHLADGLALVFRAEIADALGDDPPTGAPDSDN